ncbi:MAG: hypothetical protein CM15mP122_3990 [Bacteroidota bacterium]|nr:MAG: hypothetical protein CM15mP122_3990 [Bacteroidota bacterium]
MNQYDNLSNTLAHYETTGPEIWNQTDGKITDFVVGVGTGERYQGWKIFEGKNPKIRIWGIDTYGSVFKNTTKQEFLIKMKFTLVTEGIGEDILPKNVDFSVIDHFEKVTDKDAAVYTSQVSKT